MTTITVDELIENPFSKRTHEEQKKIISDLKPRPSLRILARDDRGILVEGEFDKKLYEKIYWLTACEKRVAFFCWPCLLFKPRRKWSSGIKDVEYVLQHQIEHDQDTDHLAAVFNLHLFITVNFQNPDAILHPENIYILESEHSMLKLLIDVICYVITDTCTNRYKSNMLNIDECIRYLNILKPNITYTDIIKNLEEDPQIINGLVDAITTILKAAVEAEIKESTYASMILSEHILFKEESQISTVLRYLKNGVVYERFVGFINLVGSKMQHKDIAKHFFKVKKNYHIRGKVLALSVDGAVLSCPELSKLFDLDSFQCKYLIPSYFHELGCVLVQSVAQLQECELFFRSIREIQSYFENEVNLKRLKILLIGETIVFKKKKWCTVSPFIVFLSFFRKYIVIFFEEELSGSRYTSNEDQARAKTFQIFLRNLKTIFLLKLFARIFQDHFDKNLNFTVNLFTVNFNRVFKKFQSNIETIQADGFSKMWVEANLETLGEETDESAKLSAIQNPEKESYVELFEKILNQISIEIKFRHKDILKLEFCSLLNCNKLGDPFCNEKLVKLLLVELESYFHAATLKSEIKAIKNHPKAKLLFKNKSIHDVMAIIKEYELFDVLINIHKLVEFVLTMPFLPPSKDINYMTTKFKQIEKFSYIPEAAGIPSGDISILCIENELLEKLRAGKSFYDDVMIKYCEMKKNGKFHQGYFP